MTTTTTTSSSSTNTTTITTTPTTTTNLPSSSSSSSSAISSMLNLHTPTTFLLPNPPPVPSTSIYSSLQTTPFLIPDAFALVEPGLYRSSLILPSHLPFLQTLNLKTILHLSPETLSRSVLSFLELNHIELIHLGIEAWKTHHTGWRPMSEELVKEAMELMLSVPRFPLIVMCTSGVHETGMVIGCLRKLQQWNFNSIALEYRSFAHTKARFVNEQFIEWFDTDLITIVSDQQPSWIVKSCMLSKS